jgi:cytochrome c
MRIRSTLLAMACVSLLAACAKKGEEVAGLPAVATPQEALAQLPAEYQSADLENGRALFGRCKSCHTATEGGPNGVGPNLWRVFGRPAGKKGDFTYSDAVKKADFTWDAEHLDHWLTKPKDFLPGTKMTFAGFDDPKDRKDLIAFLKVESQVTKPK